MIRKYIHNIAGYEEQEIVQIVIVKAWEKIAEFRTGEIAFKYWLGNKTKWICLDILQEEKKTVQEPFNGQESHYPDNSVPDTVELLWKKEQDELLREAIDSLSEKDRRVMSLRYNGLSYAQIAEVLGTTTNEVGKRIHRGTKKIKERLEQRGVLN